MTLKDAIDKDQFYIENISYSDKDLKAKSYEELETLKMQITKKISGISLSLKEKQSDEYSSKLDMGKKRALYINQRVLVYVNFLIRKKRESKVSMSDFFVEKARVILPPDLFNRILVEAKNSFRIGNPKKTGW